MRAAFDHVARRQLGLITHRELTDLGWTDDEIAGAIASGDLIAMPRRRGVYRCRGVPITRELTWLAAALAAGDDHVLAHLTGAAIWRLPRYPDPDNIDLLTESKSRSRHQGVNAHRTIWLPASHITTYRELPVTTPARTLADTCGAVPFPVLRSAANDLIRRGLMRPLDLARTLDEVPASGRRASKPMRELTALFVPGYDPGESDAELDIVDILTEAGYPRPDQQIWVRRPEWKYRIDVGYRALKHGFEFLSEEFHRNIESFHADPLRTTRLQRAGWTLWPVTSRTARAEILAIAHHAFGHLRGT